MGKIEHLDIFDKTGFRKNVADFVKEYDSDNLEAIAIMYRRKDGSIRTYWNGNPGEMLILNAIFKRDVVEDRFPVDDNASIDFDSMDEE
ncbi:MAG: hypothetical protein JRI94_00060 [Deltaproteobacteria bacterium]|nr:hypothetical protein [Deltaproteobacteria bacterium]MBW2031975.1 hypothetical protein [Deltaproteobacteria bacterium]